MKRKLTKGEEFARRIVGDDNPAMKQKPSNTPRPWHVTDGVNQTLVIRDGLERIVIMTDPTSEGADKRAGSPESLEGKKENVALIVRAVNCHEEFLELAKVIVTMGCPSHSELRKRARNAIAKAEEK